MIEHIVVMFIYLLWLVTMGYMVRWEHATDPDKRKHYDNIWHTTGWIARAFVHLYYFLVIYHYIWYEHLLFQGVLLVFTWTGFDMSMNLINRWTTLYIGKHKINSFILKFINVKVFWAIRISVPVLCGVALLLIKLNVL